jgi:hypothetical protein
MILTVFAIFVHFSEAHAKEMDFAITYSNHTNYIVADGDITKETPEKFQEFLDTLSNEAVTMIVQLNSLGGDLFGGLLLGAIIRREGFNTEVTKVDEYYKAGVCYSACSYAFLGGVGREVGTDFSGNPSQIGFHQFRSADSVWDNDQSINEMLIERESEAQLISSYVFDYITAMGVDPQLFTKINQTPADEIYVPNERERRELQIDTISGYYDFVFEPHKDGVIASSRRKGALSSWRERVDHVTAFCRFGQPHLLFSGFEDSTGIDAEKAQYFKERETKFVFRSSNSQIVVPPAGIEYRIDNVQLLDVTVPERLIDMIRSSSEIYAYLDVPGMDGAYSANLFLTDDDQREILSAFRLCIS